MIRGALAHIAALPSVRVVATSSLHETDPVGGPPGQGAYLNAAAEIELDLGSSAGATVTEAGEAAARSMLEALLTIERRLGRERDPGERNAARTIDLDMLLAEVSGETGSPSAAILLAESGLTLPHPRLHERRFVLAPLSEIAPDLRHPLLNITISELLARLPLRIGS